MSNNILVTGGAGFIGSNLVNYLTKNSKFKEYNIYVLDDLSGGQIENIYDKEKFINGTITDEKLINNIFCTYKFKYVFHLAAYAAEGLSHFIRNFNYTNNLVGSMNVINNCILNDVECLVFTSSIAVYGKNQIPMREDLIPVPEDPYGISKYSVELDLRSAKSQFDLNSIIFRPHNVYGKYQNMFDKYRNVIGIFYNQINSNLPLTVFGDGSQVRAFSYVDDIIPQIALSVFRKDMYNEIYNVGGDTPYTILELINTMKKVMNLNDYEVKLLDKRNEVEIAYSTHEKINDKIKTSTTCLEVGLKEMIEWAKNVKKREIKDFYKIEINRELPQGW